MHNHSIFSVFVDHNGEYGDQVGVIQDVNRKLPDDERLKVASKIDAVESAFINSIVGMDISIFHHSKGEIDFAGTVVLAAASFLSKKVDKPTITINLGHEKIKSWQDNGNTWIKAESVKFPPWNIVEINSVDAIEKMSAVDNKVVEHTMYWCWVDKSKGIIRARTFAPDWDIPEAEGNGSGAMLLARKLNRRIEIIHGKGSVILAQVADDNALCLGGRVKQA